MGALRDRMKTHMELRGLSPHTIDAYLQQVKLYVRYLGQRPDRLEPEQVRAYLHDRLCRQGRSRGTVQLAYCALKLFYEQVLDQPWDERQIPRLKRGGRRLPVLLSPAEVEALFAAASGLKQRALFMTIYSGGLRLSEAIHLRADDIDSQRMLIRVRQGKGRKDRYPLLSQRALAVLREYWRAYRPPGWLFPGLIPERPLTRSAVQRSFAHARRAAGIGKPASPHSLRHALASHLLEAGVHLHLIQRLLGHASPRTTTVYLHVSPADLAAIANPMDRWPTPASSTP